MQSARSLLRETFAAHQPIESGRIDFSLALSSTGRGAPEELFSVHLRGPFQSLGPARLPRFALLVDVSSRELGSANGATGATALSLGATFTGRQLFVEQEGRPFLAPVSAVRALEQGYAQATRSPSTASGSSNYAALGVDPSEWLLSPALAGSTRVAGAETVHIVAGLNVARFLADAAKLAGAGRALGLGAGQGSELLSPASIAALSRSVRSARVDMYTDAHDHLLHRLVVSASIATTAQTRPVLGGLRAADLTLVLQLAALNQPQAIVAPA